MKILDGRYYLTMSVPCECPHCGKIGMHLEDGKFGSFLSCDELLSEDKDLANTILVNSSCKIEFAEDI